MEECKEWGKEGWKGGRDVRGREMEGCEECQRDGRMEGGRNRQMELCEGWRDGRMDEERDGQMEVYEGWRDGAM